MKKIVNQINFPKKYKNTKTLKIEMSNCLNCASLGKKCEVIDLFQLSQWMLNF